MRREELVKIYKHTQSLTRKSTSGSYKQSEKWTFEDLPSMEELSKRINPDYASGAEINVVNADTLTTAVDLVENGWDPLVLNLACYSIPGGGVKGGSPQQEECIFRMTDYDKCTNRKLYPIAANEFITTDRVTVVKDENYVVLRDYVPLDFIAMSAVHKPGMYDGDYLDPSEKAAMVDKIDAIFRYAAYQEKNSLVLGALGCGAYGNPPLHVCKMYADAVTKYRKFFGNITFAVLAVGKGGEANFKLFDKELSGL
jgi:uncharacterized protein (TIGR02452 family)